VASFALRRAAEVIRLNFDGDGIPYVDAAAVDHMPSKSSLNSTLPGTVMGKTPEESDLADLMKNLRVGSATQSTGDLRMNHICQHSHSLKFDFP
jgi:hypothetical protein